MPGSAVSRRSFLQTASAGLAGALLAPGLQPGQSRPRRREETVGFAIAGVGGLTRGQILPALRETEYARLAGVVTGTPASGQMVVEEFGIPETSVYSYDTMDRMADNPDIDVVYIVTPNVLHLEHTLAAARAGKHVFCEKPMAGSAEDCRTMIDACRTAGVKLAVAYRCQFELHHLECMRLAREKVFGDLKFVEAGFGFTIGDPGQWRLRKELAGGGALMDVGVYALQAARYLTGEEPTRVSAFETKTDPVKFAEVDETITFNLEFPAGALASCTSTYNSRGLNHFHAYGQSGAFWLDPAYSYRGLRGGSSNGPIEFDHRDHFGVEMDDFAQCILENRESKVAGEEGLKDLIVVEGIYESIRTGSAVRLGT